MAAASANDGGTTTLTNCTVSGNSAGTRRRPVPTRRHGHADQLHRQRQLRHGYGGGLTINGTTTLTNCTVSGNSAISGGGGVYSYLRHGHADQLHRQRQLRHGVGGGLASTVTLQHGPR